MDVYNKQERRHHLCFDTNRMQNHVEQLKEINKSKNVLDIQIIPGHPHGAWVECYRNTYDEQAQVGVAEQNAEQVTKTYLQLQREKSERLKQFQEDVSKRLSCLQQLKRKQLQLQSMRSVEEEQNVVIQRELGLKLPYRRSMGNLQVLNKNLLKSCKIPCNVNKQLARSEIEKSNVLLHHTCTEVQAQSLKARRNMLAKKFDGNEYTDDLPGGPWSPRHRQQTLKQASAEIYPSKPPIFNRSVGDTWTGMDEIKTHTIQESDENVNLNKPVVQDADEGVQENEDEENVYPDQCGDQNLVECGAIEDIENAVNSTSSNTGELISGLQRNLILDWCNQKQKETDQGKNQRKAQYWKYRKIFMGIERDQVQQRKREEEHRKRIRKLKINKEREREIHEEKLTEFPETKIPLSDGARKRPELLKIPEWYKSPNGIVLSNFCVSVTIDLEFQAQHKQQIRWLKVNIPSTNRGHYGGDTCHETKQKEFNRYIVALRAVAKERLQISNRTVPPLCQCGPTLWDAHPDTCANNCIFYKNPKGYAKALSKVLANNR